MKKILLWGSSLCLVLGIGNSIVFGQITTFEYTGSMQTFVVPAGATSISVDMVGASGGGSSGGAGHLKGKGGRILTTLTVTPGSTLNLFVGGEGVTGVGGVVSAGGFNGGGTGGLGFSFYAGGGGGGASDVRVGGVALANRVLVAGGGGGAGYNYGAGDNGGDGGGLIGAQGQANSSPSPNAGKGGTQVAGGAPGFMGGYMSGSPGSLGTGGNGGSDGSGGGGGGGYYGGGGGAWAGAGGGSSFVNLALTEATTSTQGYNTGNGRIIIEILCTGLTVTVSDYTICIGESLTLSAESMSGADVTWSDGVINGVTFTPATGGYKEYTVISDDPSDCSSTIEILVDEVIVSAGAGDGDFCIDETVTLSAGGGFDEYSWDPVDLTPGIGTHTYTLTGVNTATGCTNSDDVTITVHDLPTVTASTDYSSLCAGNSVIFNGGGAATYAWDHGVMNGVPFSPADMGAATYTVIGTDAYGCIGTASVDLEVVEEMAITYTVSPIIVGGDGAIDITVTGGTAPYIFDWDNDGTGDWDDTEDLTGTGSTAYSVVVESAAFGCSASAIIYVGNQAGVGEEAMQIFSIYPNPTTDLITISSKGNFTYQLVAINGEVIANGTGFNQTNVSLAELTDGVYFITLTANDSTNTLKVIKQ